MIAVWGSSFEKSTEWIRGNRLAPHECLIVSSGDDLRGRAPMLILGPPERWRGTSESYTDIMHAIRAGRHVLVRLN